MKNLSSALLLVIWLASVHGIADDCDQARVDRADSPGYFHSIGSCEREESDDELPSGDARSPKAAVPPEEGDPARTPVEPSPVKHIDKSLQAGRDASKSGASGSGGYGLHVQTPFGIGAGPAEATILDATLEATRLMAANCPQGWRKENEWVAAVGSKLALNVTYNCLQP